MSSNNSEQRTLDAKGRQCQVEGYEPGCVFKLDERLKWRCVECKRLKPFVAHPDRVIERAMNN